MNSSALGSRWSEAWDPALLTALKLVAGLLVLRTGFVAISDDDFARVVIAERFAHAPSVDPSGTSWLPLPFWITGSAMLAFGRTLVVARVVAVALGVFSALLVRRAARLAGASRAGAFLGAAVAVLIPTAARLGVAFQPEALAAGLVVFGAATTLVAGSWRVAGAVALGAACLCRYEAWPAAVAFAVCSALGAERARSRNAAVAGKIVALVAPLAWILHGIFAHRDALFFLHRVAAYRRALGTHESWAAALAAYPRAFLTKEPELVLGAALVIWAARPEREVVERLRKPAILLGSVLVFLVVGRFSDGAPTHHDERALLALWTGLALVAGEAGMRTRSGGVRSDSARGGRRGTDAGASRGGGRPAAMLGAALAVALAGLVLRALCPIEPFSSRASERGIGNVARDSLPKDAALLVDTADYGYFAVIAAFGAPERADPFEAHDPRLNAGKDPFESPEALTKRLALYGAKWCVVRREHWAVAERVGTVTAQVPPFALIRVGQ